MGSAASAGLTAAVGQSESNELVAAFASMNAAERVRLFAAVTAAESASKWAELSSDSDVKGLPCAIRGPNSKMRLDIPEGSKGAIAIIACGSFSPPTLAHFRVLEDARDTAEAMGYHVIGGFMSPVHLAYGKKSLAANFHRVNMVGKTLQDNDWISVDPWECSQDAWTVTAKVIDRYQEQFDALHKEGKLKMPARAALLGGADLVESFVATNADGTPSWTAEDVEKIVSRGVCCITRAGFNLDDVIAKNEILTKHKDNIFMVTPPIENNISSTLVRKSLAAKKSLKYVVSDVTIDYIARNKLNELPNWQ